MTILIKNTLTDELEKRQKNLAEYDAKVEAIETKKAELAVLENEIANTDKNVLAKEIADLTEYAEKLGFIAIDVLDAPDLARAESPTMEAEASEIVAY